MARRLKKAQAAPKLDTGGYAVEARELPARDLLVIEPDSLLWGERGIMPADDVKEAIVWVLPPHDANDGDILHLRQRLEKHGAAHIKVMPRAPDPQVAAVEQSGDGEPAATATEATNQSLREVVMTMARERASGENLELLTEALDHALTRAGL